MFQQQKHHHQQQQQQYQQQPSLKQLMIYFIIGIVGCTFMPYQYYKGNITTAEQQ